jgi:hypothetical protein
MYDENIPSIPLDEIRTRQFGHNTDDVVFCSVCEQGPGDHLCERCQGLEAALLDHISQTTVFGDPEHAGVECYVIVPKTDKGFPPLAKAFPMDPSPVGRQLEGVPVSMGAFWSTREEAEEAHRLFVPSADRDGYEIRAIMVKYARERQG